MAFKERLVVDADQDSTTALGGFNKKTGKPNPTQIEGYFLGSKSIPSPKARSGVSLLHILQTAKGNWGVWGKTDLDRKIAGVVPGTMIRIVQKGTVKTPNGEMYKFQVLVDEENVIAVDAPSAVAPQDAVEDDVPISFASVDDAEETLVDEDEALPDEVVPVAPPVRAARPAAPSAASQAKVQALLAQRRAAK
jgi:hypothetical protein